MANFGDLVQVPRPFGNLFLPLGFFNGLLHAADFVDDFFLCLPLGFLSA